MDAQAAAIRAAAKEQPGKSEDDQPIWCDDGDGGVICQHGHAMDTHCCHCHSGFVFDGMQHEAPCLLAELSELATRPPLSPCDPEVHEKGEPIGIIASCRPILIEAIVRHISALSGQRVDWHFFGGRGVVKALGDIEKARATFIDVLQSEEWDRPGHISAQFSVLPFPPVVMAKSDE